jgi:hypothetical protein
VHRYCLYKVAAGEPAGKTRFLTNSLIRVDVHVNDGFCERILFSIREPDSHQLHKDWEIPRKLSRPSICHFLMWPCLSSSWRTPLYRQRSMRSNNSPAMATSRKVIFVSPRLPIAIEEETYYLSDSDLLRQFPVLCRGFIAFVTGCLSCITG